MDDWRQDDVRVFCYYRFDDSAPARCRYEKYPECNMTDDLLEHGPVFLALLIVARALRNVYHLPEVKTSFFIESFDRIV